MFVIYSLVIIYREVQLFILCLLLESPPAVV